MKPGGVSIMLWSCIYSAETGALVGFVDSSESILVQNVQAAVRQLKIKKKFYLSA